MEYTISSLTTCYNVNIPVNQVSYNLIAYSYYEFVQKHDERKQAFVLTPHHIQYYISVV